MKSDLISSRTRIRFAALLVLLAITHAGAGRALAEKKKPAPYALIFGTVWDSQNRARPGITVKIRRDGEKKPKWTLVSDRRGEFAQRLPAGNADYLVWAEVKGQKGPISETKVHIESDERADVGLHITE